MHRRGGTAAPASIDDMQEECHRADFMRDIDRMLRRARDRRDLIASVPSQAYVVNTGASAIALAAATAKTIMYVNTASASDLSVTELAVGFDGVTASAVPALVETCYGTAASNSTPGTGSTTFTPGQTRGWPTMSAATTAANACSSEPTVLTSHRQYLVSPNGGLLVIQFPLGREPTGLVTAATAGKQLAYRVTAPAIVNTRGYLEFEE
jgi:hypothetical protein